MIYEFIEFFGILFYIIVIYQFSLSHLFLVVPVTAK